ncbi:glycosidase [Lithospermum erythrorhizon]|uniref:Glycosidase n=1 Tax=Lithospermum erythrorhizon TaxID=34254 RepID=A0AAV3RHP7_LITER
MQAIKGGYWPSWAYSYLPPSSINTSYFTHIYYAFLAPNNMTYKFNIDDETASMLVNFTSTLRYSKNPPVKSIYSVGGAAEGPILFARMASCPLSRQRFIHSSIEVGRKFGFDGIDLDWEHPLGPKEMEDYGILLDEWRKEIQKEAMQTSRPPLLLTAAVYYPAEFDSDVKRIYPSESMNKNLDWINAMTYDYHGISREKLIMGLPIYGRSWKLKDPMVYEIGAPVVDVGPGFNGTGVMTYAEIPEYNMQNTNATVVYDSDTVSTYSVFGTDWIGYDDTRSIAARFVMLKLKPLVVTSFGH